MEIKTVLKWCFIIIIKHLESILCALDPLDIHCSSFVMWSSKMSWNSLLYWFLDRAINSIQFPLYFIVLCIAKMAIYPWNRMRNVDGVFSGTSSYKLGIQWKWKLSCYFVRVQQTHFAWSHHILCPGCYGFILWKLTCSQ